MTRRRSGCSRWINIRYQETRRVLARCSPQRACRPNSMRTRIRPLVRHSTCAWTRASTKFEFRGAPPQHDRRHPSSGLSAHDYKVRVGAIIDVLRETLPQYAENGLVEHVRHSGSRACAGASSSTRADHSTASGAGAARLPIYHPHVIFRLGAPLTDLGVWHGLTWPLPRPFGGEPTIMFRGRRVYLAGSQILRLALIGAFRTTDISLERVFFLRSSRAGARADELLIRLRAACVGRVGGNVHHYVLLSRYTFDRATGTICAHSIDSMEPLPTSRMLVGLAGLVGSPPRPCS